MIPALLLLLGSQDHPPTGTLRLHGTLKSVDLRSERASFEVESYVDPRGFETTLGKPAVQSLSIARVPVRSLKTQAVGSLRDLKPGLAARAIVAATRLGQATVLRAREIWVDSDVAGEPAPNPSRGTPRTSARVVEPDGVCRDPVLVPLVFPVLGIRPPRDGWLLPRGAYGERRHLGQDIMAPQMTPLLACFDGVVYTRSGGAGGHYRLTLISDDGWSAEYMHVNNDRPGTNDGQGGDAYAFAPGIRSGKRVRAGQLLGWNGNSGNAETTGHHLHFELWFEGAVYNAHASLQSARRVDAPVLDLALPEVRPERGNLRLDGVVAGYDAARNVLTVAVIAETRPGKSPEAETQPRRKYVRLEGAEFKSFLEGETTSAADLAIGQEVLVVGPDAGEGKPMTAKTLYVAKRERDLLPPIPPVTAPRVEAPATGEGPQQPPATPIDRVEPEVLQRFLDSANAYRKRYSAAPLIGDVRLGGIAMVHARKMATDGKTSAEPQGKPFLDQAKELGYRGGRVQTMVLVNEGDAWDAVHAWLRQADARAALLDPALNVAGVGRVREPGPAGRWFWCVLLGGP